MSILDLTPECNAAVDRWSGVVGPPSPENKRTSALRVFTSDFVERWLARSHPILPGLWFGGFIVYGAAVPFIDPSVGIARGLLFFLLGVLAWTFTEYMLHRFLFHMRPGPVRKAKIRQFMMHGYHHEFPNDKMRLVAPPLMSWPIGLGLALLYRLILGPVAWWPMFAGTCLGYLAYDWIHYYTHHFTPTTALGKYLRRIHMVHHFANSEANHGISSPLWDVVFRTYQSRGRGAEE